MWIDGAWNYVTESDTLDCVAMAVRMGWDGAVLNRTIGPGVAQKSGELSRPIITSNSPLASFLPSSVTPEVSSGASNTQASIDAMAEVLSPEIQGVKESAAVIPARAASGVRAVIDSYWARVGDAVRSGGKVGVIQGRLSAESKVFSLFSRLTVVAENANDVNSAVVASTVKVETPAGPKPVWDVVAVTPTNDKAWNAAVNAAGIDVICLDPTYRLNIRAPAVGIAMSRGAVFEMQYGPTLKNSRAKRELLILGGTLARLGAVKSLMMSSGANGPGSVRSPADAVVIAQIIGGSTGSCLDSVSVVPCIALRHGWDRGNAYKSILAVSDAGFIPDSQAWRNPAEMDVDAIEPATELNAADKARARKKGKKKGKGKGKAMLGLLPEGVTGMDLATE